MKPGKNIFNISFGMDEYLLQAYCRLGLGVFSEMALGFSQMALLNSLGLVTFCQSIKFNQVAKMHP